MDFVLEALTALSAVAAARTPSKVRADRKKNLHSLEGQWWPPFPPDPKAARKDLPIDRLVQDLDQRRFRF